MRFVQVNVPIPSFVDDGNRLETKSKNDILGIKRYQKYILFLFPLFPVFICAVKRTMDVFYFCHFFFSLPHFLQLERQENSAENDMADGHSPRFHCFFLKKKKDLTIHKLFFLPFFSRFLQFSLLLRALRPARTHPRRRKTKGRGETDGLDRRNLTHLQ